MAERDGAAVEVDLAHVVIGLLHAGQRLGGKGLVQLNDVDILELQAGALQRSEEHTSELQSLMRISYAVFCLKQKQNYMNNNQFNKTHELNNTHTSRPV